MKTTGISTDCVCDLPESFLRANDVDIVYFYIATDTGRFRDGYGITSGNLLEYLEEGGRKAETTAPDAQEYAEFFEEKLKRYDELIHISISGCVGLSCQNAMDALKLMGEDGKRVTVIDSEHLSTGMGHMVMKAVELRKSGKSTAEIAEAVKAMRGKISTTFMTRNAEYLQRNGRVNEMVKNLAALFSLHPVLTLRNGKLTLKSFKVGNHEKAVMAYIRGELKHNGNIDKERLFITHAGCPVKMISQIREETQRLCQFNEVIVTKASATVSSNCGPGTVGVIFVRK